MCALASGALWRIASHGAQPTGEPQAGEGGRDKKNSPAPTRHHRGGWFCPSVEYMGPDHTSRDQTGDSPRRGVAPSARPGRSPGSRVLTFRRLPIPTRRDSGVHAGGFPLTVARPRGIFTPLPYSAPIPRGHPGALYPLKVRQITWYGCSMPSPLACVKDSGRSYWQSVLCLRHCHPVQ